MLIREEFDSPAGPLHLVSGAGVLYALDFDGVQRRTLEAIERRFGAAPVAGTTGISRRLASYFAGDVSALDEVPADPEGSEFQRQVWRLLRTIPPGQTRTYGELAVALGNPGASRAVGLANSLNPVAIVIPCHRVIGASGKLTGYAGGLERKRWLLEHEAAQRGLFAAGSVR
jgi:methylated-DNA-[protein]-cysteine S-methyltransferase